MEPQKTGPPGPYPEPPPPYSTMPPGPTNYPQQPPQGPGGYQPHQPPTSYQPPNSTQTVIVGPPPTGTAVTVVSVAQWGPYPMQISCPHCAAQVMTETNAAPGLLTWLLSGALIFLGCWIGCCLIPCCIPECQDIEHRCPNCKHHLGTYRRI